MTWHASAVAHASVWRHSALLHAWRPNINDQANVAIILRPVTRWRHIQCRCYTSQMSRVWTKVTTCNSPTLRPTQTISSGQREKTRLAVCQETTAWRVQTLQKTSYSMAAIQFLLNYMAPNLRAMALCNNQRTTRLINKSWMIAKFDLSCVLTVAPFFARLFNLPFGAGVYIKIHGWQRISAHEIAETQQEWPCKQQTRRQCLKYVHIQSCWKDNLWLILKPFSLSNLSDWDRHFAICYVTLMLNTPVVRWILWTLGGGDRPKTCPIYVYLSLCIIIQICGN